MHVMYQTIDSLRRKCFDMREKMRHIDRNRDREIDMIMLKLTELTTLLTDKQTEIKALPSQSAPIKDVSKFSDPTEPEKNEDESKAVSLETSKRSRTV